LSIEPNNPVGPRGSESDRGPGDRGSSAIFDPRMGLRDLSEFGAVQITLSQKDPFIRLIKPSDIEAQLSRSGSLNWAGEM